MKVIWHAGVDSRMIILDDQARQQITCHCHFNATFHPSRASTAVCLTNPVMGETKKSYCHVMTMLTTLVQITTSIITGFSTATLHKQEVVGSIRERTSLLCSLSFLVQLYACPMHTHINLCKHRHTHTQEVYAY